MRTLVVLMILLPAAARAEFALSDITGTWAGAGSYTEALSTARMRCRIAIAGNADQVALTGRCASSLGAEDLDLTFTRLPGGEISLRAEDGQRQGETTVEELTGLPEASQVILRGENGLDRAAVQIRLNPDGTLYFATETKWRTGNAKSAITLVPQ